jgi:hypothetical protein
MTNKNEYYENLSERVRELLGNETYMRLSEGYAVVKGREEGTYFIQARYTISHEQQKENYKIINNFVEDFKNHLINDTPFTVLNNGAYHVYEHFFKFYPEFLFNSAARNINNNDKIIPTLEHFEKATRCFENILPSIDVIVQKFNNTYLGKENPLINFIPTILSLNNKSTYINEPDHAICESIKNDLVCLVGNFTNEKSPILREGISHYLNNKKEFLTRIKDRGVELELLNVMKYVFHSDYWSEVASQLPTLNIRKEKVTPTSDKLFNLNQNPIYQIDLDKRNIMISSSCLITDEDFDSMVSVVANSMHLHKPNSIEFMQIIAEPGKIIISGKDVDQNLALGVGQIFEKMVNEYNNNVPKSPYQTEAEKEEVKKYLNKTAEVLWLEFGLSKDNENKTKRRSKI